MILTRQLNCRLFFDRENELKPIKMTFISVLVVAAVYMLALLMQPSGTFWITDCGNKFILVQNMDRTGSINIDYPAADIDPEGQFFPKADFHFQRIGDKFQSFYPPYYPWFGLQAWRIAGIIGLGLLSMLSMLVVIWLSTAIADRMGIEDRWRMTVPVLAFCTPFFFYSQVFWEHGFSMIFSSLAFILLLTCVDCEKNSEDSQKGRGYLLMAVAGILMGVSCIFREESYLFFGATGLAMLLMRVPVRRLAAYGMAWAVTLVPVWLWQYSIYGNIMGVHAVGYRSLSKYSVAETLFDKVMLKISNFYVFLLEFGATAPPPSKWFIIAAVPAAILILLGIYTSNKRKVFRVSRSVLTIVCALLSLGMVLLLLRNDAPVINTLFTKGVIAGSPFLLLIFCYGREVWGHNLRLKFALITSAIFAVVTCLVLNQGVLGVIWGARHFLVLFPVLVPLAVLAFNRFVKDESGKLIKLNVIGAAGLLLASFLIQGHAVRTLYVKKFASRRVINTLAATKPQVIVSDVHWLTEDCAPLFFQKKFMQVKNDKELIDLITLLKRKNVKKFTLVLSSEPQFRCLSNYGLKLFEQRVEITGQQIIKNPKAGFMNIIVSECRFR